MRVKDWHRWQMTKLFVMFILVLVAIACGGGLEDVDGTLALPSPVGMVASMSCALGLMYNIIQHDRQGRR
jgi:hypothetical protein